MRVAGSPRRWQRTPEPKSSAFPAASAPAGCSRSALKPPRLMRALACISSLAHEVEHRLEQSFQQEALLGDPTAAAAYHELGLTIASLKARYGPAWRESDNWGKELTAALLRAVAVTIPKIKSFRIDADT